MTGGWFIIVLPRHISAILGFPLFFLFKYDVILQEYKPGISYLMTYTTIYLLNVAHHLLSGIVSEVDLPGNVAKLVWGLDMGEHFLEISMSQCHNTTKCSKLH